MPLNPRQISNNLRLQTLIEAELASADELLKSKPENQLDLTELVNLTLINLEIGHWDNVKKYASSVLAAEEANPSALNENIACAHYALAVHKREINCCEDALLDFDIAEKLAESNWLKGNLLRNIGLVYLKLQQFKKAYEYFQKGYHFVLNTGDPELRGSLPALLNYSALALSRLALTTGEDLAPSVTLFEQTSTLYNDLFNAQGISENITRRRSHDYISHLIHRSMILCEAAEKLVLENRKNNLQSAEQILIEALASRKENKADGQRLGDVCVWLGRVYVGQKRSKEARQFYNEALSHYRTVFPEEAKQIRDVKAHLAHLIFKDALMQHSSFRVTARAEVPDDLDEQENDNTIWSFAN